MVVPTFISPLCPPEIVGDFGCETERPSLAAWRPTVERDDSRYRHAKSVHSRAETVPDVLPAFRHGTRSNHRYLNFGQSIVVHVLNRQSHCGSLREKRGQPANRHQ
jgi:hypothetical protein